MMCELAVATKLYQTSSSMLPAQEGALTPEEVAPLVEPAVEVPQLVALFTVSGVAVLQLSLAGTPVPERLMVQVPSLASSLAIEMVAGLDPVEVGEN